MIRFYIIWSNFSSAGPLLTPKIHLYSNTGEEGCIVEVFSTARTQQTVIVFVKKKVKQKGSKKVSTLSTYKQ